MLLSPCMVRLLLSFDALERYSNLFMEGTCAATLQ